MLEAWNNITAADAGFPLVPQEALADLGSGKVMSWVNKMRFDPTVSWWFVPRPDVKRYLRSGGDPSKLVVHFFADDAGNLGPMWRRDMFLEWVKYAKDVGIRIIGGANFSFTTDEPITNQLYNLYRDAVVNRDHADHGFKVLPSLSIGCNPVLFALARSMWPERMQCAVIEGQHFWSHTERRSFRYQEKNATRLYREAHAERIFLYARSRGVSVAWNKQFGSAEWIPSAMCCRSALLSAISKARKECHGRTS